MNREIPENVYNAVNALSDFCVHHDCENCPFSKGGLDLPRFYQCAFKTTRPSYWSVVKETVFKVNISDN